ncbi:hypothetical protein RRF57_009000 [Xylaria bambusicola]|uniref:Uncharacterized protein n=1 Tax=Xylaria bambusicola TaxID=326684 RepID=A0AAN7UUV1_9PEZI
MGNYNESIEFASETIEKEGETDEESGVLRGVYREVSVVENLTSTDKSEILVDMNSEGNVTLLGQRCA